VLPIKTGSLNITVTSKRGRAEFYNHMPAVELQAKLSPTIWQNYFKFTIVRNPFDKIISAFYHFEKSRHPEKYMGQTESDVTLFRRWVKSGVKVLDKHIYLVDNAEALDFYIRYENYWTGYSKFVKVLIYHFNPNTYPNLKINSEIVALP